MELTEYERTIENEVSDSVAMMNARYIGYGLAVSRWDDEMTKDAKGRHRIGWTIVEIGRGSGRVGVVWDRHAQALTYHWLNIDCMYESKEIELDELMMELDMEFEARWWDEYLPNGGKPQPYMSLP